MNIIKLVIDTTVHILNTRISFGNISFTLMAASLGISVLGVVAFFIRKLLDW